MLYLMDVTYYNYIALVFFVLFALFVPISFLITSKMLRPDKRGNKVKNAPYESAEHTIGTGRDVANEFLSYFAIFLPFEIISIVLVLWAIVARVLPLETNVLVLGLALLSMAFALVGYKFTSDKRG